MELNPKWVEYVFKGVFVELVKIKPRHWWPVVLGEARESHDVAPETLLVSKVRVKYPQFDRDRCLVNSMASTLYYCGEQEASTQFAGMGCQFESLGKKPALKKLREMMREFVPCIGDGEVFNIRAGKKKVIKALSVEDLVQNRTGFPTIVVPYGNDGSSNHAFVVIDDIILDSTQVFAMKLCRESLDWICGPLGMAKIAAAIRFNISHGTKKKLKHGDTRNW
jgi:hypothetical protein